MYIILGIYIILETFGSLATPHESFMTPGHVFGLNFGKSFMLPNDERNHIWLTLMCPCSVDTDEIARLSQIHSTGYDLAARVEIHEIISIAYMRNAKKR